MVGIQRDIDREIPHAILLCPIPFVILTSVAAAYRGKGDRCIISGAAGARASGVCSGKVPNDTDAYV